MQSFKTILTTLLIALSFSLSAQVTIVDALAIVDAEISKLESIRSLLVAKCAAQDSLQAENERLKTINANYQSYVDKQNYIFVNNYHASINQITDKRAASKNLFDSYTNRWADCVRNNGGDECGCQDLKDNAERANGRLDILDAIIAGEYKLEQKPQ